MTGPAGSGCAHSSSDFEAIVWRAFSAALASQVRASARDVIALTLASCASKSTSNPSGLNAPSMNQSIVCAAWATCCAAVKTPSAGVKPASSSVSAPVLRLNHSIVLLSSASSCLC